MAFKFYPDPPRVMTREYLESLNVGLLRTFMQDQKIDNKGARSKERLIRIVLKHHEHYVPFDDEVSSIHGSPAPTSACAVASSSRVVRAENSNMSNDHHPGSTHEPSEIEEDKGSEDRSPPCGSSGRFGIPRKGSYSPEPSITPILDYSTPFRTPPPPGGILATSADNKETGDTVQMIRELYMHNEGLMKDADDVQGRAEKLKEESKRLKLAVRFEKTRRERLATFLLYWRKIHEQWMKQGVGEPEEEGQDQELWAAEGCVSAEAGPRHLPRILSKRRRDESDDDYDKDREPKRRVVATALSPQASDGEIEAPHHAIEEEGDPGFIGLLTPPKTQTTGEPAVGKKGTSPVQGLHPDPSGVHAVLEYPATCRGHASRQPSAQPSRRSARNGTTS